MKALQDKQREAEEESLKALFRPKINPKSVKLIEKRRNYNADVATRLADQHKKALSKLDEMRKQLEPSYQPTINDRSKTIKLSAPVHERLYHVGMEHIVSKHKFMVDNWGFSYNLNKPLNLGIEPNSPVNVLSVEQDADFNQDTTEDIFSDKFESWYKTESKEEIEDGLDLQSYEHSQYSNVDGYDEDLRQMMIEAGFFKSQHSFSTLNNKDEHE